MYSNYTTVIYKFKNKIINKFKNKNFFKIILLKKLKFKDKNTFASILS